MNLQLPDTSLMRPEPHPAHTILAVFAFVCLLLAILAFIQGLRLLGWRSGPIKRLLRTMVSFGFDLESPEFRKMVNRVPPYQLEGGLRELSGQVTEPTGPSQYSKLIRNADLLFQYRSARLLATLRFMRYMAYLLLCGDAIWTMNAIHSLLGGVSSEIKTPSWVITDVVAQVMGITILLFVAALLVLSCERLLALRFSTRRAHWEYFRLRHPHCD